MHFDRQQQVAEYAPHQQWAGVRGRLSYYSDNELAQQRAPPPTPNPSVSAGRQPRSRAGSAGPVPSGSRGVSETAPSSSTGHGGARLLNWVRNAPGLRKLRLRRWNSTGSWSPEPCGTIDLTNFHVTEGNYTKRKNVFKLTTAAGSYCPLEAAAAAGFGHAEVHRTMSASGLASVGGGSTCGSSIRSASTVGLPGSERELLLQADSQSDMQQWMESLHLVCGGSTSQLHSPYYPGAAPWNVARAYLDVRQRMGELVLSVVCRTRVRAGYELFAVVCHFLPCGAFFAE
uniref:PH domain-containing protein n=1 Tax=Anopheles epiroticus TaxID=199890 RepID=A0A182PNS1_9DIPT